MMMPQVDRHVEVPINKVALLELVGLVFDTSIILQDKLEDGPGTSLDKIDRYIYGTKSSLLEKNRRPGVPFK